MTPEVVGLANHEIVTMAVYLLRGEFEPVDTEDAAIKAAEIAPGRFNWRKYPDQVNLDAVRKRLWDACRLDKGGYLVGSERDGWRLTEAGARFASGNIARLEKQLERRPLSLREKRWRMREKERMMATDAYRDFTVGGVTEFKLRDAEKFFRIDEHVSPGKRLARAERARALFGDDVELGALVGLMARLVVQGGKDG